MPTSAPSDPTQRLDPINIRLKPDNDIVEVCGVRFWGQFLRAFKELTASKGQADLDMRISVSGSSVIRMIPVKRAGDFPDELPSTAAGESALAALSSTHIFQFGDCDWIAAENIDDAIHCLDEHNGCADEYEFDDIQQLSLADMLRLTYVDMNEDEVTRYRCSFFEALAIRLGNGEKAPFFFATSEY